MKKKLVTLTGAICLVLILVACAAPAPTPAPAPAPAPAPKPEPIKLRFVSFLPQSDAVIQIYLGKLQELNERAKGELVTEYIGGPESIPMFEQPMAVKEGVVEMCIMSAAMYPGIVPGAGCLGYLRLDPLQFRQSEAFEFFRDMHEKGGLFFLGRPDPCPPDYFFYLFINEQIEKPEGLKGKKMGIPTTLPGFYKSWGIAGVPTKPFEIYEMMQRKVIDGYNVPIVGFETKGLPEVTKYIIDHPFFTDQAVYLINLDTWNKLPKHLQDLVDKWSFDQITEVPPIYDKLKQQEFQTMRDAGMEFIKFPSADAERMMDAIYQSEWEYAKEQYPEVGAKLEKLFNP